ncbi:hypothetical protein K458DRAFT_412580 [Lentithecium fluviatile CBS 122367]|uniref:Zn(2)-C6 fungal-type domain-containing protein n=1 Tax=Lentithecium fluviatile CBS 122367 TaxID=1168545 RepID=A0A6G1JM96_9PLEO|nr:hypothetical protein K458DRAFT_412580 [Lentithecium fluviatile CBS 122367]
MQTDKLHAACDECRTRKLKCSGDTPACARCERESIMCNYSPQKPMGRPRKRRREDVASEQALELQTANTPISESFTVPSFSDIGLLSPGGLGEFSGYAQFQDNEDLSNALLPTSFPEGGNFGHGPTQALDFNLDQIDPTIDPSLWQQPLPNNTIDNIASATTPLSNPQPQSQPQSQSQSPPETDIGPCTCFSIMYLTITDLQSLTNLSFPTVVPRLRQAMITAIQIINCERCPTNAFSAIQNVQSVAAVLSALAERFHKVLMEIEREAQELENEGKKKPFRVGDSSPENIHLHTGAPDCPMAFEIELSPSDWKKFAKQGLKYEVLGGGQNKAPLINLITAMEERQRRWHADKSMYSKERARLFGAHEHCSNKGEEAMCLRMVHQVRRMIDCMDWES